MYRLTLLLRKIYVLLIFLMVEGAAIYFYAHSTVQSRAKILSVSDNAARGIYDGIAGVEEYLGLGRRNKWLASRVQYLENELAVYREHNTRRERAHIVATARFPHEYVVGRVVRNSVNRPENYIMVDRGSRDGVKDGMAVATLDGCMVGYVQAGSERNAICVSVLNTGFRASGLVARTGHVGSISWPGGNPRTVKLSEVPKYAEIAVGDTILTSSHSFHFPEGLTVGTIESFEMDETTASYNIDVRLGADIAAVHDVVLIASPELFDRIELEKEVLGEETVEN